MECPHLIIVETRLRRFRPNQSTSRFDIALMSRPRAFRPAPILIYNRYQAYQGVEEAPLKLRLQLASVFFLLFKMASTNIDPMVLHLSLCTWLITVFHMRCGWVDTTHLTPPHLSCNTRFVSLITSSITCANTKSQWRFSSNGPQSAGFHQGIGAGTSSKTCR
ncbi:hypothetical protein LZ31DRAFT_373524 [Colletotrichum somersetense]|nr:hypothetical protein LZ31DRAFT_373524 [Colletotrichum somersetense]